MRLLVGQVAAEQVTATQGKVKQLPRDHGDSVRWECPMDNLVRIKDCFIKTVVVVVLVGQVDPAVLETMVTAA